MEASANPPTLGKPARRLPLVLMLVCIVAAAVGALWPHVSSELSRSEHRIELEHPATKLSETLAFEMALKAIVLDGYPTNNWKPWIPDSPDRTGYRYTGEGSNRGTVYFRYNPDRTSRIIYLELTGENVVCRSRNSL